MIGEPLAHDWIRSMKTQKNGPLCRYEDVVEYECTDTWPAGLSSLFERNFDCLKAYECRCHEIEKYRIDNAADLIKRASIDASNKHEEKRNGVIKEADRILEPLPLLGFHCTRLTVTEIADIRASGLKPLSMKLIRQRLKQVHSERLIPIEQKDLLLRKNHISMDDSEDNVRKGTIHFVNCRSVLRDEHAVGRMFRSWGGEAVYNMHEGQSDTGPLLKSIGKPAIVITSILIAKLELFWGSSGKQFLLKFLNDRDIKTFYGDDIETHTKEAVPANMILDIITFDDDQFETLTKYSTWREPIA